MNNNLCLKNNIQLQSTQSLLSPHWVLLCQENTKEHKGNSRSVLYNYYWVEDFQQNNKHSKRGKRYRGHDLPVRVCYR